MISKEKKEKIVKELTEQKEKAQAVYFTRFLGLKVAEMDELRQSLRKSNAQAQVVKKNLAKIVFAEESGKPEVFNGDKNSLMVSFAFDDPIGAAKVLWNFSKKNEQFQILGGISDGVFLASEKVIDYAKIPSPEILLGRLVGSLSSPMHGMLYVLNGNISRLVAVLDRIRTAK